MAICLAIFEKNMYNNIAMAVVVTAFAPKSLLHNGRQPGVEALWVYLAYFLLAIFTIYPNACSVNSFFRTPVRVIILTINLLEVPFLEILLVQSLSDLAAFR